MPATISENQIEFERSRKKIGTLPLTPMIDIMFILIIFFMLTTTFMRIESLELLLPSTGAKTAEKSDVMHLFIQANGDMLLGSRKVDQDGLIKTLKRLLEKDEDTRIMLLTAEGVTMQQLVGVMDRIYLIGGRSLFVRKWETAPAAARKPAEPVIITSPETGNGK